MAEKQYFSHLQNGLAKQRLLLKDKVSGSEMILGQSFNIPYGEKYIPRNKLHRVLAAHENLFRTVFFLADNPSYAIDYIDSAKKILKYQSKDFDRSDMIEIINSNFQGKKILLGQGITYPNFGLATMGYVEDNHVISQIIKVCKIREGHPHEQIFAEMREILLHTDILNGRDLIILDIHCALNLCENCFGYAEKLVKDFERKGIELIINVSYTAQYGYKIYQLHNKIIQKQVELIFLDIYEPSGRLISDLMSHLSANELEDTTDLDLQLIDKMVISSGRTWFESAIAETRLELIVYPTSRQSMQKKKTKRYLPYDKIPKALPYIFNCN